MCDELTDRRKRRDEHKCRQRCFGNEQAINGGTNNIDLRQRGALKTNERALRNDHELEDLEVPLGRYHESVISCKYGNNCFFRHDQAHSIPQCDDFRNTEKCAIGNRCYFRHVEIKKTKKPLPKRPIQSISIIPKFNGKWKRLNAPNFCNQSVVEMESVNDHEMVALIEVMPDNSKMHSLLVLGYNACSKKWSVLKEFKRFDKYYLYAQLVADRPMNTSHLYVMPKFGMPEMHDLSSERTEKIILDKCRSHRNHCILLTEHQMHFMGTLGAIHPFHCIHDFEGKHIETIELEGRHREFLNRRVCAVYIPSKCSAVLFAWIKNKGIQSMLFSMQSRKWTTLPNVTFCDPKFENGMKALCYLLDEKHLILTSQTGNTNLYVVTIAYDPNEYKLRISPIKMPSSGRLTIARIGNEDDIPLLHGFMRRIFFNDKQQMPNKDVLTVNTSLR